MKTYEFKNTLFNYFNSKIVNDIPELNGKIFREHLKVKQMQAPFVVIKSGERSRINKRHERFFKNDTEYTRVQYRILLTFCVHSIKTSPVDAEYFADDTIDYIENFFIDNAGTHADLNDAGIVINELLSSGVRDTSSFSETNTEFIREIDIAFEFENITEFTTDEGKELQMNILSKN